MRFLSSVELIDFTLGSLLALAQSRRISKSYIADQYNNTHVLYCLYNASISYAGFFARENIIIIILILVFSFLLHRAVASREFTSQKRSTTTVTEVNGSERPDVTKVMEKAVVEKML